MPEEILDGTGKGYTAQVDSQNRVRTYSTNETIDRHRNVEGAVFSIHFNVTPTGANDYFYYMKNTGTADLMVTDIRISSSVATSILYEHVSGTPSYSAENAITPTNRNLGSSGTLDATASSDVDITGLTSEGVIFFEECANVDTRYKISTSSNIIIPQGQAMAFKRVAATGALECVVSVYIAD